MADYKQLIILVLTVINPITCNFKHPIHEQVEKLNNRSRELYGHVAKVSFKKSFDENSLMYPRGDTRKLMVLSYLWREYYTCAASLLDRLTSSSQQLPSLMISVYQGAVARMSCDLCVEPGDHGVIWMYAPSLDKFYQLAQLFESERLMFTGRNLTIFNVAPEDAGVYQCRIGDSNGGLKLLEVVDADENYTLVKPATSQGPQALPPEVYKGTIIFSAWSPWSECSVCGKVGRRRRFGLCYVKLDPPLVSLYSNKTFVTEDRDDIIRINDNIIELFDAFPEGIPCRSQFLPSEIKELSDVQQRTSEIMIGLCKVSCPEVSIGEEILMNQTRMLGTSAIEMFSLSQVLPPQPPLPIRNTIFVEFGEPLCIRCPGTTLRDVPVLWRIGTKYLVARDMDVASGGRVHLNARDHLVFRFVLYKDANVYSCWEAENLAGTVKIIIWEGTHSCWNHRVTLLTAVAALVMIGLALHVINRALRSIRQRQSILYYLN